MGGRRSKKKKSKVLCEELFGGIYNEKVNTINLDIYKYVLKKEQNGVYCIYNISNDYKILIRKIVDKDDEYALNCAIEILEYLTKEI